MSRRDANPQIPGRVDAHSLARLVMGWVVRGMLAAGPVLSRRTRGISFVAGGFYTGGEGFFYGAPFTAPSKRGTLCAKGGRCLAQLEARHIQASPNAS